MLAAPKYISYFLLRPVRLFRDYDRSDLRPDLIAAVTVTVILLPQALAYALIVERPPEMGIYAAVVAGILGGCGVLPVKPIPGPPMPCRFLYCLL